MKKIIVRVEGGIVQNVFSDDEEVEVVVFDFDDDSEDCPSEEVYRNQIQNLKEIKMHSIIEDDN